MAWGGDGGGRFAAYRQHEVLDHALVVNLVRAVHAGRAAREALSNPPSSSVERRRLRRAAREGKEALDCLITHNLRLVMKYAGSYRVDGLSFDDHFQNGVLGLLHAIEKFDPERDIRLSTYATWWIRQSIERGIATSARLIRLPVHVLDELRRLDRVRHALLISSGNAPVWLLAEQTGMTEDRVRELLPHIVGTSSLDAVIGDGLTTLGETIPAPEEQDRDAAEILWDVCSETLAGRALEIIALRFGFAGEPLTLDQVGDQMGVTRERVRQIQSDALKRLEKPVARALDRQLHPERNEAGPKAASSEQPHPIELSLVIGARAASELMPPRSRALLDLLLAKPDGVRAVTIARKLGVPPQDAAACVDRLNILLSDADLPCAYRVGEGPEESFRWPQPR